MKTINIAGHEFPILADHKSHPYHIPSVGTWLANSKSVIFNTNTTMSLKRRNSIELPTSIVRWGPKGPPKPEPITKRVGPWEVTGILWDGADYDANVIIADISTAQIQIFPAYQAKAYLGYERYHVFEKEGFSAKPWM